MTTAENIQELVSNIVVALVDNKEDVKVDALEKEGGEVRIEVRVKEEDAGRVIGRSGRIIKSIRTLARSAARETRVEVELID